MNVRLHLALFLSPFALMCSSTSDPNTSGTTGASGAANMAAGGSGGTTGVATGASGTATGGTTGSGQFNPASVMVSATTATVDTNGDGTPDGVPVDTDANGVNDAVVVDTNGDGVGDQVIPNNPSAGTGGASGTGGAPAGGSSPTAGAGGTVVSVAGSGGTPASGGSGGASGVAALGPTAGCQAPAPTDAEQTWLEHDITVADLPPDQVAESGMRRYWVRLPLTYDHTRAYPIVFYGPGCGASGVEGTPMMDTIKDDAIHVFLIGTGSCFSTGGYPTPEVPYFNQVLDEVQAAYCTDASKVFVSGYSSGGWLSHDLACGVGDRIRGVGSAAGGLTKSIIDGYDCATKPKVAAMLYSGENDTANPAVSLDANGFNKGVTGARDRLIVANGCDMAVSEPWPNTLGIDYCTEWKTGCEDAPVVYCVGPGDGHGNGGIVSQKAWWEFWTSLP